MHGFGVRHIHSFMGDYFVSVHGDRAKLMLHFGMVLRRVSFYLLSAMRD